MNVRSLSLIPDRGVVDAAGAEWAHTRTGGGPAPGGAPPRPRRVRQLRGVVGRWGAAIPAIQRHAGVDHGELGSALLFVGVGALASMRTTGALIDRFGRAVLPLGILAFAAAGVGPGLARGVGQLAPALLLVGVTSGAVGIAYLGFVAAPAAVGLTARATSLPVALGAISAAAAALAVLAPRARAAAP